MRVKIFEEKRRFYFIGIGGISMSALAKMLLSCGYRVCGFDATCGRQVQILRGMGVKVSVGEEDFDRIDKSEIVVYTDAIEEGDERLKYAKEKGKQILSRGQLLAALSEGFSSVIAIAGSHGKTTCTAMCTHAMSRLGVPYAAHIGGEDLTFDNFVISGLEFLITEACEYKKNLSYVKADCAVLLNVDKDHMECYQSEEELKEHFFQFLKRARLSFVCLDDLNCRKYIEAEGDGAFITFSIEGINADYNAVEIKRCGEGYSFWVKEYGKRLCRVKLNVPGRHNVSNALAAVAVMRSYGFDEKEIVEGLQTFKGVKRRFERLNSVFGAKAIADYAHHPKEIVATLKTVKEHMQASGSTGRLFVVFQPHTYSRTKLLMSEFIEALKAIKNLVVYRTFAAREKEDAEGSAYTLAGRVGAIYADNVHVLEVYLRTTLKEEDTVLFLGAGDIYSLAVYLSGVRF